MTRRQRLEARIITEFSTSKTPRTPSRTRNEWRSRNVLADLDEFTEEELMVEKNEIRSKMNPLKVWKWKMNTFTGSSSQLGNFSLFLFDFRGLFLRYL